MVKKKIIVAVLCDSTTECRDYARQVSNSQSDTELVWVQYPDDTKGWKFDYYKILPSWTPDSKLLEAVEARTSFDERMLADKYQKHKKRFIDVMTERVRQDAKFGADRKLNAYLWLAVLGEEVGEVNNAVLESTFGSMSSDEIKKELVQVAAVCFAMLEDLDNNGLNLSQYAQEIKTK